MIQPMTYQYVVLPLFKQSKHHYRRTHQQSDLQQRAEVWCETGGSIRLIRVLIQKKYHAATHQEFLLTKRLEWAGRFSHGSAQSLGCHPSASELDAPESEYLKSAHEQEDREIEMPQELRNDPYGQHLTMWCSARVISPSCQVIRELMSAITKQKEEPLSCSGPAQCIPPHCQIIYHVPCPDSSALPWWSTSVVQQPMDAVKCQLSAHASYLHSLHLTCT